MYACLVVVRLLFTLTKGHIPSLVLRSSHSSEDGPIYISDTCRHNYYERKLSRPEDVIKTTSHYSKVIFRLICPKTVGGSLSP